MTNFVDNNELEADVNEIFENILFLEERCHERGFIEGLKEGQKRAQTEGTRLGLKKGVALGTELGFYRGFVESALDIYQRKDETKFKRHTKLLKSLLQIFEHLPIHSLNCEKGDLIEDLEEIRAKFKQLSSVMGLKTVGHLHKDVSF